MFSSADANSIAMKVTQLSSLLKGDGPRHLFTKRHTWKQIATMFSVASGMQERADVQEDMFELREYQQGPRKYLFTLGADMGVFDRSSGTALLDHVLVSASGLIFFNCNSMLM